MSWFLLIWAAQAKARILIISLRYSQSQYESIEVKRRAGDIYDMIYYIVKEYHLRERDRRLFYYAIIHKLIYLII